MEKTILCDICNSDMKFVEDVPGRKKGKIRMRRFVCEVNPNHKKTIFASGGKNLNEYSFAPLDVCPICRSPLIKMGHITECIDTENCDYQN